jgi:hypothetical protein
MQLLPGDDSIAFDLIDLDPIVFIHLSRTTVLR